MGVLDDLRGLGGDLEARLAAIEARLAEVEERPVPDTAVPTYQTVDAQGKVGANFSGHVAAAGVDLPAVPPTGLASQTPDSVINWTDILGLYGPTAGAPVTLWGQEDAYGWGQFFVATSGPGSARVTRVIDLAGNSDFIQKTDGNFVADASVRRDANIAKSKLAPLEIVDSDVSASAAIAEAKLALASDGAQGTATRRSLGPGILQAAPGAGSTNYLSLASGGAVRKLAIGTCVCTFPGGTPLSSQGAAAHGLGVAPILFSGSADSANGGVYSGTRDGADATNVYFRVRTTNDFSPAAGTQASVNFIAIG